MGMGTVNEIEKARQEDAERRRYLYTEDMLRSAVRCQHDKQNIMEYLSEKILLGFGFVTRPRKASPLGGERNAES